MDIRPFGHTGLRVSALGLGAGPLGSGALSDADAERLIHGALDLGVTLFDTARSYGASEARLGRALRGRRERAVLSTKVGYGIDGVPDWTAESVRRGIEEACVTLGTDWLDVVHLHSCPEERACSAELTAVLDDAVRRGQIRVAAYSGEDAALDAAARHPTFGALEMSVNPWDQGGLMRCLGRAKERGMGVIAKRPLANAWWASAGGAERPDIAAYAERGRKLALPTFGLPREALSLRFAAFTWGGFFAPAHRLRKAIVARAPGPPRAEGGCRTGGVGETQEVNAGKEANAERTTSSSPKEANAGVAGPGHEHPAGAKSVRRAQIGS